MIAKYSCLLAILAINAGCVTWTPSANDAAAAVALVAPQYAGTAATVATVIGTKAKTKSSSNDVVSLDGYTPGRIYRVRGTVTEAKDISWTDIWSREGNAATDDISSTVINSPVATVPMDQTVNIPATNTTQDVYSSDDQAADQATEDVEALRKARKR